MAEECHRQYVTDWIYNKPGVEKEFEIDFSLNSATKSNFSGYVWKFVTLYLVVFSSIRVVQKHTACSEWLTTGP
jgi:hypothetical protein